MCRNIKTLHNYPPPATQDEIRASAVQFVRKLSGFTHPSKATRSPSSGPSIRLPMQRANLLDALVTHAPPRDRGVEAAKARERGKLRFART